jgi:hypothetical protein
LLRLIKILWIALRFGLDEFALAPDSAAARTLRALFFFRTLTAPRAVRLRLALEALGPIFVKFGQVLSTRRDLLPADLADELAKLQDRVPPFDGGLAVREVERAFGKPIAQVYESFELAPVASASVAQVHLAALPGGTEVAVKVLRPGMLPVIGEDLALLDTAAGLVERFSADGRRLRPREVVAEFARHLSEELDLMREAAHASQLRRNFQDSPLLVVPEVYWDWCATNVMTMQRMRGTPVSQVEELRRQGVDIPRLARTGVEIFFTQVFRHGFFHADMHPGNILVTAEGRYVALDFGIMGTLTEVDKQYLAQNFLGFFQRDYARVARAHLEAGCRVRGRDPRGVRTLLRPAAGRNLVRPGAGTPVPDLAPLQRRDPAAAGDAAEDAAQHRGAGAAARPRPGPVGHRQALPREMDARAGRIQGVAAHAAQGSALLGDDAAAAATAAAPRPRRRPGRARREADRSAAGAAAAPQPHDRRRRRAACARARLGGVLDGVLRPV